MDKAFRDLEELFHALQKCWMLEVSKRGQRLEAGSQ
jgi:hypothetical protein